MVMLAVLGLVPNAAAQPLDRLQRAFLNTPLERTIYRGETDTLSAYAQAAPTVPWRIGDRPLRQGLARRSVAVSLSAVDLFFA